MPNVEIIPLIATGLSIQRTSGQTNPEILGFSGTDEIAKTTLQHKKTGNGTVEFLTLLMPMPNQNTIVLIVTNINSTTWNVSLSDGRTIQIIYAPNPTGSLSVTIL